MENIRLVKGLSNRELQDIRQLEMDCCKDEQLNMKLNWDMLERRPSGEVNDLMYYDDEKLTGYIGIYDFKKKSREIEITGMVHPECRRRGIFNELFSLAKQECIKRKGRRILLITERLSAGGTGFAKSIDSKYSFSEYRMKFEGSSIPEFPRSGIILRKAELKDNAELQYIDKLCFGLDEDEFANSPSYDTSHQPYMADMEGDCIGKIGVLMDGNDGYVFGFGIKPEYRRRGYGREVLSLAMLKLLSDHVNTILLEVAVENERALQLYKSCGFKEITVYDYYEIIL